MVGQGLKLEDHFGRYQDLTEFYKSLPRLEGGSSEKEGIWKEGLFRQNFPVLRLREAVKIGKEEDTDQVG